MTERSRQYAAITLALQHDPDQYGAEAMFNQALTVALIEIANPAPKKDGKLPPARELLRALTGTIGAADAATLDAAVVALDAVRHGRATTRRPPTPTEVDALARLDHHPNLHVLNDAHRDDAYVRDLVADNESQHHAAAYLATLDDDEITRRVDTLPDYRTPGGVDEPEPQDCPVCGSTTLLAVGCDPYGYGIGAGHCHVCSYYRSPEAAEREAWTWEMHRLTAKPDPHDDHPQQPDVT